MLRDSTTIEIQRQRLIFRGRVLQDDLTLTDYSISTGQVLHMVARPINDTESFDETDRNSTQNTTQSANSADDGRPQLPVLTTTERNPMAPTSQLHLNRNELELLNQLMTGGESQSNQDPSVISQIQQQQHFQQRQQHIYTSSISSYSFQPASRFSVPISTATLVPPAAPSVAFTPATFTSARSNVNSSSDSIERIRQGLLTMDTIMSTMIENQNSSPVTANATTTTSTASASTTAGATADDTETEFIGKSVDSSSSSSSSSGSRNRSRSNELLPDNSRTDTHSSDAANSNGKLKADESPVITGTETGVGLSVGDGIGTGTETGTGVAMRSRLDMMFPIRGTQSSSQSSSQSPGIVDQNLNQSENRRFHVGQWIDVKDTVSQWLEATIVQVDEEGKRVFVHYNGW